MHHPFQRFQAQNLLLSEYLDEVHKNQGLVLLLAHLFVHLRKQKDVRVKDVKLLLITATREGRSVESIETMLRDNGIQAGDITVTPRHHEDSYHVESLWKVANMPKEWHEATMPERACLAAESAAHYLL